MTSRLKDAVFNTTNKQEVEYDTQLILDWMDDKVYMLDAVKNIFENSIDIV